MLKEKKKERKQELIMWKIKGLIQELQSYRAAASSDLWYL